MSYALTFDDGPGPSTDALLDVLEQFGVRATFFILGRNLQEAAWTDPPHDLSCARRTIVRAMKAGHAIANHSMSHSPSTLAPPFVEEVEQMDALIRGLRRESNIPPDLAITVRLPYGEQPVDPRVTAIEKRGREHVGWTAAFGDWLDRSAPDIARDMCDHVGSFEQIGLRSVLLLHDGAEGPPFARPRTVEAVRMFLETARSNGWEAVLP